MARLQTGARHGSTRRLAGTIKSIPAPTGGWNARDSVAEMDERDAVVMENMFPTTADVILRNGWSQHATGLDAPAETLMPYNSQNGPDDLLFVAAGDSIYDATGATAVGSAAISGLTNARFQYVNFANSDGDSWIVAVNGADVILYFDGTDWMQSGDSGAPLLSGVDSSTLIGVMVHKRRLWFVEENTLDAWYLPVDSVGGEATRFRLSGIADRGGYLMSLGTWTLDAGAGPDDYWVAVTSEGQVVVYAGTNPNSIATWGLVGVWNIGQPLGRRCLMKYGGDLLIICIDGVLPLAKALISSRVNPRVALTDKISGAMSEAATLYKDNFGWETQFFPAADMLVLNVPVQESEQTQQFAMNTLTGAWGLFTGILANCWCVFNEEFYFGSDAFVGKFWETPDDDGSNINGDVLQAFNYFGLRSRLKRWTMGRPILVANGIPAAKIGLNVDYDTSLLPFDMSFSPYTTAVWDTALWDQGIWGGGLNVFRDWQGLAGIGFCAGVRLGVQSQGLNVRWQATDIVFEPGEWVV